jgi:hypothetical protein
VLLPAVAVPVFVQAPVVLLVVILSVTVVVVVWLVALVVLAAVVLAEAPAVVVTTSRQVVSLTVPLHFHSLQLFSSCYLCCLYRPSCRLRHRLAHPLVFVPLRQGLPKGLVLVVATNPTLLDTGVDRLE